MKTKFLWLVVSIEIFAIFFMVFFYNRDYLPGNIGVLLAWFLPVAFGLHLMEEFVFPGGFREWNMAYKSIFADALTPSYLIKINLIGGLASIFAPLGVFNYMGAYSFGGVRCLLLLMALFGNNAWYHVRGSILTKKYSPGMITGIFLYVPLLLISYFYFIKTGAVGLFSAIICLILGAFFQNVLDFIKQRIKKSKSGTITGS